ncbi:hypothetical protein AWB75_03833 [Caballeronia catudaia]|uniref:Lipoprotein n=1 Tax=Caballeronia catudaia TaxID=1777136 RepID=A0A158BPV4_9BURK|nr:DUF3761 domain-containing protein [Caballeronia catudaia]SAK72108.1 hypothetical protein AWB75_03833 [Caballeronia catudaia]
MQRLTPMRTLRAFAVAALVVASAAWTPDAFAYRGTPYQYQPQPDESDLDNHGHYVNRDGNTVHSPAHSRSGTVPTGATAQCRDGTYSFSQHHSGTCSRHGGVAQWQ